MEEKTRYVVDRWRRYLLSREARADDESFDVAQGGVEIPRQRRDQETPRIQPGNPLSVTMETEISKRRARRHMARAREIPAMGDAYRAEMQRENKR